MVMRRYEQLFAALEQANQEHYDQIRTSLGHPECQEELSTLEKKERERQFKTTKGKLINVTWFSLNSAINERDKELHQALTNLSRKQIDAVCNLAEKYLTGTVFFCSAMSYHLMIEDDERTSSADLLEVEYNSMDECIIRIKLGSKKFVSSTVD